MTGDHSFLGIFDQGVIKMGGHPFLRHRHKSGNDNEKREHKASLRVVLRLSLQSEDETNDPLKSGPALAGPAGPPTPPLCCERCQV